MSKLGYPSALLVKNNATVTMKLWFDFSSTAKDWTHSLLPIAAGTARGVIHAEAGKPNQDRFAVNAKHSDGFIAVCVCDGHGPEGHLVADTAARVLMLEVEKQIHGVHNSNGEGAVKTAMHAAQTAVEAKPYSAASGATATVVLVMGSALYVASVGDCEAVLLGHDEKDNVVVDLITEVHRTNNLRERARIEASGGVIQAGYVVAKDPGTAQHGKSLAITRSLGDLDMRRYGIVSDPYVCTKTLTKNHTMLIVGTDGLWGDSDGDVDVQSRDFLGESVAKYYKYPQRVVKTLYQLIGRRDDDTTVIVMRIDI